MIKSHHFDRIVRCIWLAFFVFFMSACATTVKEQERDTTSSFRGFWGMTIIETPPTSLAGSYRRSCWDAEGYGNLQIAGGYVVARVSGYDLAGFIKPNGKFTAVLDLKKGWVFRLRGQLNAATGKGEGKLVHNRVNEGLAGCTSTLEFEKTTL